MSTILGQRCTVFLDGDGVQRFKIDSSIDAVEPGDLPTAGPSPFTAYVFVHKIVLPDDPKSDTFLRVGNVADLTTLPQGREVAKGLGQTLYVSTAFSVIYDDIATASTAKKLIQQRVDNLIADWHTYNEQFLAPETVSPPNHRSDIPLPLTTTLEDERKAAYNDAHAELLTAKATSAVAATTATATITAATAANEAVSNAVLDSQECSSMLGQFNGAKTAIDAYRNAVNLFAPSATTLETASLTFQQATITFQTAAATYIALGSSPGAGPLATFTAAKTTFDNAYNAWNIVRAGFSATALNNAIAAEALSGAPVMATLATNMAVACSGKIADVQLASQKKATTDKAAADAATAKKAADVAQSAALIADTQALLSVKELCPDFEPTVP